VALSIATRELPGDMIEIRPQGELDLQNAHELRDAIDAALTAQRPPLIRVDLGEVTFIDSVAIGALVGAYHAAAASGVRLVVSRPSEFVYRQLFISGLVGLFGWPQPRAASPQEYDEPEPVS
jgi:anti-sigma B factor antagonist